MDSTTENYGAAALLAMHTALGHCFVELAGLIKVVPLQRARLTRPEAETLLPRFTVHILSETGPHAHAPEMQLTRMTAKCGWTRVLLSLQP